MSLKPFCFEPTVEDIDNRIYEALRVNPIQTINYMRRTSVHPSNWCLCKKCPLCKLTKNVFVVLSLTIYQNCILILNA